MSNEDKKWSPNQRRELFGVPLWDLTPRQATAELVARAITRSRGFVVAANVHTLTTAHYDSDFRKVFTNAKLVIPDGKPLIWALNSLGLTRLRLRERVTGPSLMLDVIGAGQEHGLRHFFYGGTNGTATKLIANLQERFPSAQFAGYFEPPFRELTDTEEKEMLAQIDAAQPHVIWVGLGAPKQEVWMSRLQNQLPCLAVGVGAAFDFHSGRVKRAPDWLGHVGGEWLFRLVMEPRRLWRRYYWSNPRFLALWVRAIL